MKNILYLFFTLFFISNVYGDDFEVGMEYFKSREYDKALKYVEKAFNENPKKADVSNTYIALLAITKDKSSLSKLKRFANENRDNIFIQTRYAFGLYMNSDFAKAIEVAKKVEPKIKKNTNDFKYNIYALAFSSYSRGDYTKATDYLMNTLENSIFKEGQFYAFLVKLSSDFSGENAYVKVDTSKKYDLNALLVDIVNGLPYEDIHIRTTRFDYDKDDDLKYILFAAGEYARLKKDYDKAYEFLSQSANMFLDEDIAMFTPLVLSTIEKIPKKYHKKENRDEEQYDSYTISKENEEVKDYLKNTKDIDIEEKDFANMLLMAQKVVQHSKKDADAWLRYATLLLALTDVYDAQITAQDAALNAYEIDENKYLQTQLMLMQSNLNMLDYPKAASIAREILYNEDFMINDIGFLNSYITSHSFSGDIEEGLDELNRDLIYNPSHYGAHAGMIELLKVQIVNNPNYKDIYERDIVKHKKTIKKILDISASKMEKNMKQYLQKLIGGAL